MKRAVLLLALVACNRHTGDLQLVDIKRGDLVVGVVVTGELAAVDSTDIKPPSVNTWNFKISMLAPDGMEVKQGEPVAGFDTSEQARELATMMNEVEAAKKKLEKKLDDAALARREEELAIANSEANLRKATLKTSTPGELVASIDLKVLQLDEKGAQIGVDLAKNKAAQAKRADEAELASLRDRLAYTTGRVTELQKNLAKMAIVAPRAGTIVYPTSWRGEKKKVGDNAWRGEVVLQVVGLDKMIGKGAVDEVDISRVATNQVVSLQLDALPDLQIRGKVQDIARSVRAKSNTDPSKVVELKIALEPTKASLRPGMRFRGEVETARVANVVIIPTDAVFVTPEGPVAYRSVDGKIEKVKLELGERSATLIEVKSGLSPGDRVSRNDPETRGK
ncbi:MAG: HlyD family efflux transporter periplasmic adaptor subunit [Kofleriaceae bacterium]